jgi:hypothetical protein
VWLDSAGLCGWVRTLGVLPVTLPCLQPTFTRRTSRHSLGKSRVINFVPSQPPRRGPCFKCIVTPISLRVRDVLCGHECVWNAVGSRFATVCFTTIHFYDPCRVGLSTPDLWCITVATRLSFLYLVRFQLFSDMHVFLFYFSAVVWSWLWFFNPWRPSKRQKRKIKTVDVTFFLDVFWTRVRASTK